MIKTTPDRQPLSTIAYPNPSFTEQIINGTLSFVGLLGTGIIVCSLIKSSRHSNTTTLTAQIFGALGCLCLTCLAGKNLVKPKTIQAVPPPMDPTTQKTNLLNPAYLQQLQPIKIRLDTLLKILSKEGPKNEKPLEAPTLKTVIAELEYSLEKLESKIHNPDKEYIFMLLRKAQRSRSNQNSAESTPYVSPSRLQKLQSPEVHPEGSEIIDNLDDLLASIAPLTPTDSLPGSPDQEQPPIPHFSLEGADKED